MSAENETIADIAAKSRSVDDFIDTICRRVKIRKPSKSSYWAVVVECMYNEIRHLACRNQPVNAAAMREAAESALSVVREIIDGTLSRRNQSVFDCRDKLKSALARPPRNCDLYADESEARAAFLAEKCEHPYGNCTVRKDESALCHPCGIEWLFAIAKKGGAK